VSVNHVTRCLKREVGGIYKVLANGQVPRSGTP
jgi:hypothetical protein